MILALIGISMPVFWLGEVLNLITQDRLHDTIFFSWVPPLGYVPFTQDPGSGSCTWSSPGSRCRSSTSGSTRACSAPTCSTSRTRTTSALPRPRASRAQQVLVRHVLRNSMITFVSLFGLDFGVLVGGGALLTEVVFNLPGVG